MAIGGRHRTSKRPEMAINDRFVTINRPGGSKLVDQRGSRLDLFRANLGRCVGTLSRAGMAIGGRHRASKPPKMAIDGRFEAISRPGGSKLVDQGWIMSGHNHDNVLGPFSGSGMAIGRRHRVQEDFSVY